MTVTTRKKNVAPPSVTFQLRMKARLLNAAKVTSAKLVDASVSDFMRRAIENEISRQSLAKPEAQVSMNDLAKALRDIQAQQSFQRTKDDLRFELLKSVSHALGIKTHL